MKQKLALLLVTKLHAWSILCQPFTGENPPNDRGLALACFKTQIQLTKLVHQIDLLDSGKSVEINTNETRSRNRVSGLR